jgi:hypothetical protein
MSLADPSGWATRNNRMLRPVGEVLKLEGPGRQPAVTSLGVLTGKSGSAVGARDVTSSMISFHGADQLGYQFHK